MQPEVLGLRRSNEDAPQMAPVVSMAGNAAGSEEVGAPWTAPTYADTLASRGELTDVQVRCPGCRRSRPAWAVVDVRALPPEVRGSAEWACDACREAWRRDGVDFGAVVEALGAPPAVVLQARGAMTD
jgi:hypothetical protein